MPVITVRPNVSIQTGTWTIVGGGGVLHTALSDNLDTSYIQNVNKCRLQTQVAKVGIGDVALPTGSKIYSVRVRVRLERVAGTIFNPSPICIIILLQKVIEAIVTGNVQRLFQIIFGFLCPRPEPTVGFVTQDLAFYLEQPAGGEWTQQSFNDFEVHLGRDNTGANLKIAEVYVDVDYNERPVATAVLPTGTVVDTTRPLLTHTYTDPESDRQQAFRWRIFSQAQYSAVGFDPLTSASYADSGWVAGEDLSWNVNKDLVNGLYRAYIQVEQVWGGIGVHRSVQTFVSWTQSVPGPPNPVLTATPEAPNRVRINVVKGGSSPATETYTIEFSDNAGVTWAEVRNGIQLAVDGAGAVELFDYEAPLNVARKYRALAFRTLGSIKVASGFSNEDDAVPASLEFWLKDPLAPSLNTTLPVANDSPSQPRSQGVFAPLIADDAVEGRTFKITVTGPQYGVEGRLEIIFTDDATWEAFRSIQSTGRTLLLQYPNGEQHYVSLGSDLSWEWMLINTDVYFRRATISYVEVSKP